jgi:hypothetical protein
MAFHSARIYVALVLILTLIFSVALLCLQASNLAFIADKSNELFPYQVGNQTDPFYFDVPYIPDQLYETGTRLAVTSGVLSCAIVVLEIIILSKSKRESELVCIE